MAARSPRRLRARREIPRRLHPGTGQELAPTLPAGTVLYAHPQQRETVPGQDLVVSLDPDPRAPHFTVAADDVEDAGHEDLLALIQRLVPDLVLARVRSVDARWARALLRRREDLPDLTRAELRALSNTLVAAVRRAQITIDLNSAPGPTPGGTERP